MSALRALPFASPEWKRRLASPEMTALCEKSRRERIEADAEECADHVRKADAYREAAKLLDASTDTAALLKLSLARERHLKAAADLVAAAAEEMGHRSRS